MLPSAALTAVFLLALAPGWTYLRLRSSRNAVLPRAGLDELLEVVTVGMATTGVAAALWAVVPASTSHLLDVARLASEANPYAVHHVRRLVVTALVIFVVAELLALVLFKVVHRGPRSRLVRETVWAGALGRRYGRFTWIGLELRDGRLVEGQLLAYPTGDEHESRDIALQAPIRLTRKPGEAPDDLGYDRIILNEDDINNISIALGPLPTSDSSGWQARWQRGVDRVHAALSFGPT